MSKDKEGEEQLDSIEIPTTKKAGQIKGVKSESKKIIAKIAEARNKFARLVDDEDFIVKMIDIKRFNNGQEKEELAEAITSMVVENPSIVPLKFVDRSILFI